MSHLPTLEQLVESWIHVMPHRPPILRGDEDGSATARGNFLGEDTSDPDSKGKAIYTELQNLPTAVASLLNHVQDRANFHPASTPPDDLIKFFNDYVTEIDGTPFFHLLEHKSDKQSFYSRDYNLLIDQVVNLYDGISAQDQNAIKTSITDMAKSVFGQEKSESWKNLFSQSTLDLSDFDNPKIFVYYTSLHMKHDESGKANVQEQDYTVATTTYAILTDQIVRFADKLAALDEASVDDWTSSATTKEDDNAPALCFRPRPFKKAS